VEALALLENVDDIAVLISDSVMPGGLNGHELAERARALRPALPILLVTGYTSELSATDESIAGIPVLRKPFDPPALATALSTLLPQDSTMEGQPPCR
jgi:CheY-like chemotaxis protein